ncbi:uncharacterized protein OCT59_005027 [Rhizophagus irregularis]|uniref:uncharacterized protein n=1 Tax=Rhizophagus irregularis TaxID=588596 RepID=UPI003324AF74|nr:hypothetical protein OCT59_005027 [Rhizophagus irregularis]
MRLTLSAFLLWRLRQIRNVLFAYCSSRSYDDWKRHSEIITISLLWRLRQIRNGGLRTNKSNETWFR